MPSLPVNAFFGGVQPDGYWGGIPSLIVGLMPHPEATSSAPEASDGFPLPEWDYDPANEVSLTKLMTRNGRSSPHFASVAPFRLFELAKGYREKHFLLIGRQPGLHDLAPLVSMMIESGRSVQIETTDTNGCRDIGAWITLLTAPSRSTEATKVEWMPDEVVASIRWRADLDRIDMLYGQHRLVWLRPSTLAEPNMYWQCLAVATRHVGWRVLPAQRNTMGG